MGNYLKTKEVLKNLDIEIFELFDLCKKGKLQAYNEYGKRVVDPDLCEKGKKNSWKFYLYHIGREEESKGIKNILLSQLGSSPGNIEKLLTRDEQEREAREQYSAQPDTPIIPENCVEFDFALPAPPSKYQASRHFQKICEQKIEEAETFKFKKSNIEELKTEERLRLEKECGSDKPVPKSKQSVDEFVRSLAIYPEDDYTINIQIPGRKAEPFTASTLGFHKERGKEWRLLQKIIQEGRYCTGSSKTNEGDANRNRLMSVNKKMIKFLNEKFNARIPPKYKLFEKSAKDEKGTRTPKFKMQSASRYSNFTKEQLLEKLKAQYKKDADSEIIQELVVAAKEKGISNDDLTNIIPSKRKNEEEYEYREKGGHITNTP
ncbi:MAG: hypothetical protein J7M30_09805 [Deltaproteobacteria bacterium]|nr:hypothetical protein [Deltaproteobacteria bacterium]